MRVECVRGEESRARVGLLLAADRLCRDGEAKIVSHSMEQQIRDSGSYAADALLPGTSASALF